MTTLAQTGRAARRPAGAFELAGLAVVLALCLAGLLAFAFLFRIYSIPSSSMTPTLLLGDQIVVSRHAYGYSRHSLPMADILPYGFSGTLLPGGPKRGDLAVFKLPRDNATDYVKRIVGLPGDRVQMVGGRLHIDGQPVARERVADHAGLDAFGQSVRTVQYAETLPGGATYRVIERDGDRGFWDNTQPTTVPAGHVFTLGDNRDNSTDSRDLASVGYVPVGNLVGRVDRVLVSLADAPAGGIDSVALRWNRLLAAVR